jgi:hypothetical protein
MDFSGLDPNLLVALDALFAKEASPELASACI